MPTIFFHVYDIQRFLIRAGIRQKSGKPVLIALVAYLNREGDKFGERSILSE